MLFLKSLGFTRRTRKNCGNGPLTFLGFGPWVWRISNRAADDNIIRAIEKGLFDRDPRFWSSASRFSTGRFQGSQSKVFAQVCSQLAASNPEEMTPSQPD
jgi:hypothetical protein